MEKLLELKRKRCELQAEIRKLQRQAEEFEISAIDEAIMQDMRWFLQIRWNRVRKQ